MASDKYILAELYTHWNKCWLGITSRAFSVHFQHYSKKQLSGGSYKSLASLSPQQKSLKHNWRNWHLSLTL